MVTRHPRQPPSSKHGDDPQLVTLVPGGAWPAHELDVVGCFEHLLAAIGVLARAQGSPNDVVQELGEVRRLLGKES